MATVDPEAGPNAAPNGDTLHSWKEIAGYLRRDVRTVQRWEKSEGLPVHRLWHKRLGSIFAYKSELDAWWSSHRVELEAEEPAEAEADALAGEPARPVERKKRLVVASVLLLGLAVAGVVAWRGFAERRVPAVSSPIPQGTAVAGCSVPGGLVGYWPGEDSVRDVHGENHGRAVGVNYGAGKQGLAFVLDGQAAAVTVPRSPLKSEDFTVAAWVKFETLEHPPGANTAGAPQGDMSIVDAMSNEYVNRDGWRLLKHHTQRFLFCLGGGAANGCGANGPAVFSKTVVARDTWYQVAGVKSGTSLAILVNGKLEALTELGSFRNSNSSELRIGSYLLQGAYLNGLVDEVMLFDRGLTSAEVQSLYQSTQEAACRFDPAASAASAR